MKDATMRRIRPFISVVTLGFASLLGCSCNNNPPPPPKGDGSGGTPTALSGKIEIDGSSTVYKLSQAVAQEFTKTHSGVKMKVDKSGTGGGFKKFVKGELDICDASRPIQESELKLCAENGVEFIELPICFDALTIAVNRGNDWAESITTDELKKLWEPGADSKITKWNQIRPEWPDHKISLFGAGTDSGTFEYFTEAICEKKGASRSDYTASEDDNAIILGIEGDKYALGYVPFAYYAPRTKTLKALKVDWTKKMTGPVEPSRENVEHAKYNPLSRPLFIYVNRKAAERPEVKGFVDYYVSNGRKLSEAVKYIPLRAEAYDLVKVRFDKLQIGTAFGGHTEFGLPVEEILQREIK
jgi:phosphate transport system substrate-binding protein